MSEKKQFFKEEVTAYTNLFNKHSSKVQKTGKDGVSMIDAADILKTKTDIPWKDQIAILLKAYGMQIPAKSKLNNLD